MSPEMVRMGTGPPTQLCGKTVKGFKPVMASVQCACLEDAQDGVPADSSGADFLGSTW